MTLAHIAAELGFAALAILALWWGHWFVADRARAAGRAAFDNRLPFNPEWDAYTKAGYRAAKAEYEARFRRERTE